MAEVFAAQLIGPAGFEKDVAVKRLLPRFANDAVFLERFLNEARLSARLVQEPLEEHRVVREARQQPLDGDVLLEARGADELRREDLGHPAAADALPEADARHLSPAQPVLLQQAMEVPTIDAR